MDRASGYDMVAYHSYAKRRYYEMVSPKRMAKACIHSSHDSHRAYGTGLLWQPPPIILLLRPMPQVTSQHRRVRPGDLNVSYVQLNSTCAMNKAYFSAQQLTRDAVAAGGGTRGFVKLDGSIEWYITQNASVANIDLEDLQLKEWMRGCMCLQYKLKVKW